MLLYALDVGLQVLLAVLFILGIHVVHECCERYLGVDDYLAVAVNVHDYVGAQVAAGVGSHNIALAVAYRCLYLVVYALCESL